MKAKGIASGDRVSAAPSGGKPSSTPVAAASAKSRRTASQGGDDWQTVPGTGAGAGRPPKIVTPAAIDTAGLDTPMTEDDGEEQGECTCYVVWGGEGGGMEGGTAGASVYGVCLFGLCVCQCGLLISLLTAIARVGQLHLTHQW